MTNAQLGTYFRAICEFALYGSTKMEDIELKYAFNLLTDKIKRDQAKYDEVSKKRSEIAKKARSKQLLLIVIVRIIVIVIMNVRVRLLT